MLNSSNIFWLLAQVRAYMDLRVPRTSSGREPNSPDLENFQYKSGPTPSCCAIPSRSDQSAEEKEAQSIGCGSSEINRLRVCLSMFTVQPCKKATRLAVAKAACQVTNITIAFVDQIT